MARVLTVVGTRPNFVKMAPVVAALERYDGLAVRLLHTGQHYDRALSDVFLHQLTMPAPDVFLGVGSGTHAEQTSAVLVGVERALMTDRADALLVAGDVNSTMAAALAAAKLRVPVVHLEAGLRSGDWSMPEEVNRVVTDRVSDLLLCPSRDGAANLLREGIEGDRVAVVGNTMIDSLRKLLPTARESPVMDELELESEAFVLVTLHRPALVDDLAHLRATMDVLAELAERMPVVLPLHPRTRSRLASTAFRPQDGLRLTEPLDYLRFLRLESEARLVVTDSGGVQEETTALGVPCLTYRTTTERPITIDLGTNRLIGTDPGVLRRVTEEALATPMPSAPPAIPLWDGDAGVRAAEVIARFLADGSPEPTPS